jgi:hypothetical protein
MRDQIESWRKGRPRVPPLSVAVRDLIEKALDDPTKQ